MSGFQDIGGNIFDMNGFICPAARTRTFTEIPLRSNIGKETVKQAFRPNLMKIGGGNDKGRQIVL